MRPGWQRVVLFPAVTETAHAPSTRFPELTATLLQLSFPPSVKSEPWSALSLTGHRDLWSTRRSLDKNSTSTTSVPRDLPLLAPAGPRISLRHFLHPTPSPPHP